LLQPQELQALIKIQKQNNIQKNKNTQNKEQNQNIKIEITQAQLQNI
jgi:hypothetical protein